MGAQANGAPVIIKRKKVVAGGGHHGGAWKVAYADFVTAMMAFFMLMWLLNATTEQQRTGLADYFSPTITVNRVSGGGNAAFGGETVFSEQMLTKSGIGATAEHTPIENSARGDSGNTIGGEQSEAQDEAFHELENMLTGRGGESTVMENALRHIVTRITDEGMVIELFDIDGFNLFENETARPTQLLLDLTAIITGLAKTVTNKIAIGGHVHSVALVRSNNPVWELSTERATQMRLLLETAGEPPARIQRVTGHADRKPVVRDPMSTRNNRLEIVLLREGK